MTDLHDQFRAAAEEYANRIAAKREAENSPGKTTADNGQRFAKHIEQQLNEQRANGTRLDLNTL